MSGIFAASAQGEHMQPTEPELSVLFIQKNDILKPSGKEAFYVGETVVYAHKGELGLWLSVIETPNHDGQPDYVRFRPVVTYNPNGGPVYFVGGVSTDSKSADFIQAGYWYIQKFGKLSVYLDHREYTGISTGAASYLDTFNEVTYKVSEKVALGVNVAYDRFWSQEKNWLLAGPVGYYDISKKSKIFLRPSREWTTGTKPTDRYRVGITYFF
jgi:hypothetical protein